MAKVNMEVGRTLQLKLVKVKRKSVIFAAIGKDVTTGEVLFEKRDELQEGEAIQLRGLASFDGVTPITMTGDYSACVFDKNGDLKRR